MSLAHWSRRKTHGVRSEGDNVFNYVSEETGISFFFLKVKNMDTFTS